MMQLEPITRAEQIVSGQDLIPITREEMFLAKAAGRDVETPTPITRRELFLSQISGGSSGGGGNSGGGSTEEWIGDGNTHIWITLQDGRTSPMLGVGVKGTVTVDWGDGTTPDVLTGTRTSTVQWTPNHEYAKPGDYVITLTVDGDIAVLGSPSVYSYILCHASKSDGRNQVYRCSVNKVELGDSVTSIGDYAFYNCCSLTSVIIPDSVTSIGDWAFYNCYSLTSVIIPDSVTSIGSSMFYNCCSLTSVIIPDSVTSIGSEAFNSCYCLASVIIPDSVTSIGDWAFVACKSLTSVIILDGVTSIGEEAFNSCYCLASVIIPDSVTSIGAAAFSNCDSLAYVIIPDSVTSIGAATFSNCKSVRYYDFTRHTAVPTLSNINAFNNASTDCEIRVPSALYDDWKAATNWAKFASKIVAV